MSEPHLPGITPEAEFVTVKIPDNPTQSDVVLAVDALMGYPARYPVAVSAVVPSIAEFSSRWPAVFNDAVGENIIAATGDRLVELDGTEPIREGVV